MNNNNHQYPPPADNICLEELSQQHGHQQHPMLEACTAKKDSKSRARGKCDECRRGTAVFSSLDKEMDSGRYCNSCWSKYTTDIPSQQSEPKRKSVRPIKRPGRTPASSAKQLCVDVCSVIAEFAVSRTCELGPLQRVSHQWHEAVQLSEGVWRNLVQTGQRATTNATSTPPRFRIPGHVDARPKSYFAAAGKSESHSVGDSLLHEAARYGNEHACRQLIAAGAPVDAWNESTATTPLMVAADQAHEAVCRVLIENGADIHTFFHHNAPSSPWFATLYPGKENEYERQEMLKEVTFRAFLRAFREVEPSKLNLQEELMRVLRRQVRCAASVLDVLFSLGADPNMPDRSGTLALHEAAKDTDEELCRVLLNSGAMPEATDSDKKTALDIAVDKNADRACEVLLTWAKDHHRRISKDVGHALLCRAVSRKFIYDEAGQKRNLAICSMLLAAGAPLDFPTTAEKRPPLHLAIDIDNGWRFTFLDRVVLLLEAGANVNSTDHEQKTALHVATEDYDLSVCEELLKRGAKVDAVDEMGRSPLAAACRNENFRVAEVLLAHGASPILPDADGVMPLDLVACLDPDEMRLFIKHTDRSQIYRCSLRTVEAILHLAVDESDTELCRCVAAVLEQSSHQHRRWPAISVAVKEQNVLVCKDLVGQDGLDVNATGMRRTTALHLAAKRHLDLVKLLLDAGAEPNVQTTDGLTPLHLATNHMDDSHARMKLLIEAGADVNCVDRRGRVPLHFAARLGRLELCQLLMQRGATLDVLDDEGLTPLAVAARGGFVDVCRALCQTNADVNLCAPPHLVTPAHVAARHRQPKVFEVLDRSGADLTMKDVEGKTPFDVAADARCSKIAKLNL